MVSSLPTTSTRSKLVSAMRELSLTKGYEATRVDEVISLAGVSKGSFYHHFKSKEELALAALESYFQDLTTAFLDYEVPDGSAYEKLFAFFDHAERVAYGSFLANGCLMGVYTVDLAASNERVRAKLDEQFRALEHVVFEMIEAAADELGVQVPAWPLAVQFEAILEGSLLLAKAHGDPTVLGTSIALFADGLRLRLERE